MSGISQGSHANLILDAGDVFRIATVGVATVVAAYGAPAGTTTLTAQTTDFGPYGAPAKLIVTAVSGPASYSRLVQDGRITQAQAAAVAATLANALPSPANTLAVIGDSRLSSWRSTGSTISSRNPKGYLSWALAYSGERLTVISDQSQGGSALTGTTGGASTNIVTTQLPLAIASGAGHLLVEGSPNDFFTSIAATAAAVKAAWVVLLDAAVAAGMRVWIVTSPTPNATYSAYTLAAQGKMLEVNAWLRSRVSTTYARRGVVVIDVAAKIVDPASTTASARTNYYYDDLHLRNLGAQVAGAEVARVWNLFIPEAPQLLSSNADNKAFSASSTNILTNGLMVDGATLATGFTSTVTGTGATTDSLVARSDGFGNDQQRVITFGANNDSVRMLTADLKANIADGDTIVQECEISLSAMTGTRAIRMTLVFTGATSTFTATTMELDSTNDLAMTSTTTFILKTNPYTVNLAALGALTSVQGTVSAFGSAAASGVTLKIGRWSVCKVIA